MRNNAAFPPANIKPGLPLPPTDGSQWLNECRREGRFEAPEVRMAKVARALNSQRKLPADPSQSPGWKNAGPGEKVPFPT